MISSHDRAMHSSVSTIFERIMSTPILPTSNILHIPVTISLKELLGISPALCAHFRRSLEDDRTPVLPLLPSSATQPYTAHPTGEKACSACSRVFSTLRRLKRHVRVHMRGESLPGHTEYVSQLDMSDSSLVLPNPCTVPPRRRLMHMQRYIRTFMQLHLQ